MQSIVFGLTAPSREEGDYNSRRMGGQGVGCPCFVLSGFLLQIVVLFFTFVFITISKSATSRSLGGGGGGSAGHKGKHLTAAQSEED